MFKISGRQKSFNELCNESVELKFNCIAFFQHTEVSESLGTKEITKIARLENRLLTCPFLFMRNIMQVIACKVDE